MATFRFKTGPLNGSASLAGAAVVDQFNQNLRFGKQTSSWNIAGAAPLLKGDVIYYRQAGNQSEPEPQPTIYCGQRFIEFNSIDYLFTDPPQQLSLSKNETRRAVSHVRLYTDPKDAKRSGADICSSHLLGSDEEKNIAATLEAMAALQKWDTRATSYAILSARALSPAAAARVAKRAVQAKPELDYFRTWRTVAEDADQHASLVPEFAALAKAQPDNPDFQYLNEQNKHDHARHAVDFALLARQLGQADPEQWIRQVDKDETSRKQLDVQRARASLPVPACPYHIRPQPMPSR